jgi:hypothetical protein
MWIEEFVRTMTINSAPAKTMVSTGHRITGFIIGELYVVSTPAGRSSGKEGTKDSVVVITPIISPPYSNSHLYDRQY